MKKFSFLILRGNDEAARQSIVFYHSCGSDGVASALNGIKDDSKQSAERMSLIEVLKDKYARRGVISGSVISFMACFSGNAGRCKLLRKQTKNKNSLSDFAN